MGVLSRLIDRTATVSIFGRDDGARQAALEHSRLKAMAVAQERGYPNSFEAGVDDPARLIVSQRRIVTRNMDEIIGMCRMVLADGAVDDNEARLLLDSLESSLYAKNEWPGNVLYQRLARALVDGKIDPDEEKELLELIHQVSGGRPKPGVAPVSGAIPYDDVDVIEYSGQLFVLTGQFAVGSRKQVSALIEERGGGVKDSCSRKTRYLIVGEFGSEEWLHSTHGRKILKALELRQKGDQPLIVPEKRWAKVLDEISAG